MAISMLYKSRGLSPTECHSRRVREINNRGQVVLTLMSIYSSTE